MAFDVEKYTTLARQQGIDPDVIDATIASKTGGQVQQPQSTTTNKVLDFLAPQTLKAAKVISQIPQAWTQNVKEIKQNVSEKGLAGLFAAPSPELRQLYGGSSVDTGNRFANAGLDAWNMTQTSTRAGAELGSLASILKNVGSWAQRKIWPAVRYPTLKGAYAASTNAATEAGASGKTIDLNKVITNANTVLEKGTQPGKAKLVEVIAKAFPEEASTVSPNVALETRGLLTKSLPKGFLGKVQTMLSDIMGGTASATERAAAEEATNALRQSLTNEIHATIPGTVTPDRAYAIWKNMGGDLPAWGKSILKAILYEKVAKTILPGPLKQYLP
jgi:hypothetical protein